MLCIHEKVAAWDPDPDDDGSGPDHDDYGSESWP